jgi:multidrug efflux pump subunit AcrB
LVNLFITIPVFAGVVPVIMVLAGAVGYMIPLVAQLPSIVPLHVVVSAADPGASG